MSNSIALHLEQVRFAYPGTPHETVLSVSEWSVSQGEHVFVHGPSGSGKSTLLGLLSGILCCREGAISVLGERLDRMSARQRDRFRANHIGYVFQQFNLIPYLNAIENVALAWNFSRYKKRKDKKSEIADLLGVLNIASSDRLKPTARLSIGQQQRVAIARALVNRPQLLIADEPTSSLDQENRDNFMSVLMPIVEQHGMTLLFVSHDMSLSRGFGRREALADINHGNR